MPSNSAGGNSANAAKNLLNQAQGFAGPGSSLYSGFQNSLGTAQGNQSGTYSNLNSNISNLQGLSATGGYDPNQLSQLESQAQGITSYGGYNPTQLAGLNSQTAGMTASGGYDPSQVSQIGSGYSDLAITGGFTPQQENQYLQRATEGTQATYGALEQQAKNAARATGGLGTGGALSQMARQLSQVQGQNTLDAEVGLNQQKTANKLAGLSGESNLAGQVAGNRLAAQGQQLGLAGEVAGNTLAGQGQQLGLASSVAGNKLSGTEAAGSQLGQLYNSTTGQVSDLGNKVLQTLGLDFSTQEQAANILAQVSKNPTLFQNILGGLTSAGGAAAGAAGALGVTV